MAIDYGIFGDKASIRREFSDYLARVRDSAKAEGCSSIYTHGEKEAEMRILRREKGIPVNDKTLAELQKLGAGRFPFPKEV
jgi:LDH2 family malate/lactate/ureidoglycolate dehydrogenase